MAIGGQPQVKDRILKFLVLECAAYKAFFNLFKIYRKGSKATEKSCIQKKRKIFIFLTLEIQVHLIRALFMLGFGSRERWN